MSGGQEQRGRIGFLVVVLVVSVIAWFVLAQVALRARAQDPATLAAGPTLADFDQATGWATDLLGLAATLAGFLGVATATRDQGSSTTWLRGVEGGMVGILAGATLLGVGGWPVPVALVAVATGGAAARTVRAFRER